MANLVSTDVLLILNNRATMRRDEFTADIVDENIVRIRSGCGSIEWKLDARKDTVNDELSDTAQDLFDVISAFSIGGGDGDGVTWDDVSNISDPDKIVQYSGTGHVNTAIAEFPENAVPLAQMDVRVPVLGTNEFLVNRGDGNVSGAILASDVINAGLTPNGSVLRYSVSNNQITGTNVNSTAVPNTMVIRTATGAISTATATDNGHAVNLGQFQGIINDTLTASQTSAEMNGLYPSIAIGSEVTTKTNLTTYRKLDATTWEIRTITIA